MKKYLNTQELVINFKINMLVRKRNTIQGIGGSTVNLDTRIKELETSLRRPGFGTGEGKELA
jgi:hypothetical protein